MAHFPPHRQNADRYQHPILRLRPPLTEQNISAGKASENPASSTGEQASPKALAHLPQHTSPDPIQHDKAAQSSYADLPRDLKIRIAENLDIFTNPGTFTNFGRVNKECKAIHDELSDKFNAFPDANNVTKTRQQLLRDAILQRKADNAKDQDSFEPRDSMLAAISRVKRRLQ